MAANILIEIPLIVRPGGEIKVRSVDAGGAITGASRSC